MRLRMAAPIRTAFRWIRASIFTAASTPLACTRPTRSRVGKSLAFTASGRYNRTSIDNIDRLPLVTDGSRGSLNGQYVFDRFNPAAGVTYIASRFATVYFSYSEAAAPQPRSNWVVPIPTSPATCPMRWSATRRSSRWSPELLEAGVRGTLENNMRWSVGWFREKTTTIFCSWPPNRPASAISRTSARRGVKEWKQTSAHG